MTAVSAPTSNWARMAAILLIALGCLLAAAGILSVAAALPAFAEHGLGVIGLGSLGLTAIGLVYLATGVGVWRQHRLALAVGLFLCIPPILLGLALAPSVLNPVPNYPGEIMWAVERWVIVLSIVPATLIVAGLLLGSSHFQRHV